MKILVVSDLHFEFTRDGGGSLVADLCKDVDVLVAAGDISVGEGIPGALKLLCQSFKHAQVIYIQGNHEYYNTTRERVHQLTAKACEKHENLHWLRPGHPATINGQRFLGGTMWFPEAPRAPKHLMNDFHLIKDFETWVYQENRETVSFLDQETCSSDVVVTHYLPSYQCVAEQYVGSPLNVFFVCDVEHVIKKNQPKLWFFGHTHSSFDDVIDKTRLVCNPFGYARREENPRFDFNKVTEV